MNIQIKPITKVINNVRIILDINPEQSLVLAHCHFDGFPESQVVFIKDEEYNAWGSDDNYIYDLVLSKLNLERA